MAKRRIQESTHTQQGRRRTPRGNGERRVKPSITDEGREVQLISDAYDLAGQQMREGTASAQVITHFLKLGSSREKLEQARLERENLLLSAKYDAIQSGRRIEELYETALNAMRQYSGQDVHDVDYYED